MPALISYTPYETLVFFQNVAQHGVDTSSLLDISAALKQNQFIRDSDEFDATKFSPDALQHLYDRIINAQDNGEATDVNGDAKSNNVNPLKRKVSTTPPPRLKQDPEQLVQQFVDSLYAQFKAQAVKELREHEQEYNDLQQEISKLEDQPKPSASSQAQISNLVNEVDEEPQPTSSHVHRSDPVSEQLQAGLEATNGAAKGSQDAAQEDSTATAPSVPPANERGRASPVPVPKTSTSRTGSASGTPAPRTAVPPPSLPSQPTPHHSPGAYNRTLPPPSPQRGNYGPLPPPPNAYPPHQQPQVQPPMLPSIHSLQRMPSYEGYPPHQRPPSQGRGSPNPQHPQSPYPQYSQYQPPPPHGWHSPSPQYPQPQQYQPPPQHYPPPPPNRYPQIHTPSQPPYQPYPHTAPVPYPNHQQWRGPPATQYHQYPASASTTPVPRHHAPSPVPRSANSTPWKKRSSTIGLRARSPSRLDREISPLSDHEDITALDSPRGWVGPRPTQKPSTKSKPALRDRSTTPGSRSESVTSASPAPETLDQLQKRRPGRPPKIKAEPPSTPVQNTPEAEDHQRSSGRRGRARTSISTGVPTQPGTVTNKRKREHGSNSPGPTPFVHARTLSNPPRAATQHIDPNFVLVSKSFGKTSQLLLNEITSHKLAGIFAKPLSERDAPGYKNFVYRPQDLKSIKAAITKGSKAAIAAIDDLEGRLPSDDSELMVEGNMSTGTEGPVGNGFYLVHATEDLLPPKGIVNFAQLEMELVRMFANAVMFNPLPPPERGFGKSLRVKKRGGHLLRDGEIRGKLPDQLDADKDDDDENEDKQGDKDDSEDSGTASESESTTNSSATSAEEDTDDGGIISDAREMFKDVEDLVARWRELEGEKMSGGGSGSGSQQQHQHHHHLSVGAGGAERQASVVSAASSHADGPDDGREGTPTVTGSGVAGSVRKRRRVGDA